jgi:pyrroline-5-carboxylate reductase
MSNFKLGIIGGGVMAEAILSRLLAANIYAGNEVLISDPIADRRVFLTDKYGVQVTDENPKVSASAEVVLLAIKPQIFDTVVSKLAGVNKQRDQLVISILAGVGLRKLESGFPLQPIIRAMPNTPATVGAGITAIAAGKSAQSHHISLAKTILQAIGDVVEVPESLIDGVTGVSGSGPAYVALMIESLADGGVAAGLPRAIAAQLALQTVLGTAQLLQQSGLHPAQLKDQVASPGGTTIAAISQLERSGFRSAIIDAVLAAAHRSQELGK